MLRDELEEPNCSPLQLSCIYHVESLKNGIILAALERFITPTSLSDSSMMADNLDGFGAMLSHKFVLHSLEVRFRYMGNPSDISEVIL